jgi:uncharacterized protein YegL
MAYTKLIGTSNPTLFLFLIDQSSSMSTEWNSLVHPGLSRSVLAAKILNQVLSEIISCCMSSGTIKDRCHIAIVGYGSTVSRLLPLGTEAYLPVSELPMYATETTEINQVPGQGGKLVEVTTRVHEWVQPVHHGRTSMAAAFEQANSIISDWLSKPAHSNSYPPMVINITDGEPTDSQYDLIKNANEIMSQSTTDGSCLVFNINITSPDEAVKFPASQPLGSGSSLMFSISSVIPLSMRETAGFHAMPENSRLQVVNADPRDVTTYLQWGTVSTMSSSRIQIKI